MASFQIETIEDPSTGHVLVEVRKADGGLVARSGPIYATHGDATDRLLETISKAWPQQPVDPVYPANGS